MAFTVEHLRQDSRLPGPRSNLELLYRFIEEADEAEAAHCLHVGADAGLNSPDEFVLCCGVAATIRQQARAVGTVRLDLGPYANHPSWRIREAVCMGLQKSMKDMSADAMLKALEPLRHGNCLERRTYIATLCEPDLLKGYIDPEPLLETLLEMSLTFQQANRLDEAETVLKKALGYCWSVALCAADQRGRAHFEALMPHRGNRHIRWIISENLKKKRLERLDAAWVNTLTQSLSA